MNLFLFNANDRAATYGIGSYLKELTNVLAGTDIKIHIVHLHSDCNVFKIENTEQAEHWYVPEVRNHYTFSGDVKKLESYCRNVVYLLRLHINDTKNLVFHFHFNQYQFLALELKTVFDCKTVTTVHFTTWSLELLGNLSLLHTLRLKPENQRSPDEQLLLKTDKYESLLYKGVDRIIALSQDMKDFLCAEYLIDANKVFVIPNGMNHPDLKIANNDFLNVENGVVSCKKKLLEKWRISEKEFIVLFVGRLDPVKGLLFLIRAFHEVLDVIPNCRLIIAGSGNYDIYLQEAKDIYTKITFTGLLGKRKLYELYQISNVGVVPSLYEPFGLVALEMMIHQLPIVATSTSGLNEVLNDNCGLKIPVIQSPDKVEIDTRLLAEKIIYLLQHPKEARKIGENGRKRYEKMYTSEIFGRNMINFYQSLLDS